MENRLVGVTRMAYMSYARTVETQLPLPGRLILQKHWFLVLKAYRQYPLDIVKSRRRKIDAAVVGILRDAEDLKAVISVAKENAAIGRRSELLH